MKAHILPSALATIFVMGFVTFVALELAAIRVEAPYLLYLPAVVFCYRFGGKVTALSATLIGSLSTWYFFIPPVWTFQPPDPHDLVTLLLFVGVSLFLCAVIHDMNREIEEVSEDYERLRVQYAHAQIKPGPDHDPRPDATAARSRA